MRKVLSDALAIDIRRGKLLRPTSVHDRSAPQGVAGQLPEGWQEAATPEGRPYYYNEAGETRWERPAEEPAGDERPKPSTALAVVQKPVIPGGVAGIGKLPRGWRMVTGADGKPYYWNKKSGEVSWEPPPPDGEGAAAEGMEEKISDVKEALKDGWRRTKQQAAVKVFKAATTAADPEFDAQYEKVLQVEKQITSIKESAEAYLKSLVEMCWSGEAMATKLCDYSNEPGSPLIEPAKHAATVWHELQKGATRALEQQFTAKVLKPIQGYLAEVEGLKQMHEARQKRLVDFDYYRRKVAEMQLRLSKDPSKLQRNAEKLQTCEVAFLSVNNELRARMTALIAERWDFTNAPFTQMLDFQQSFYSNLSHAVAPLAPYTTEAKLLDAEARSAARETLKSEALTQPVTASSVPGIGQATAPSVPATPQLTAAGYAQPAVPSPGMPSPGMPSPAVPQPAMPQPAPPRPPPAAGPAPGTQYRATAEYQPSDARMISMSVGELMIKEKDEGGWYFGRNSRGEQGYYPASYVEPIG